MVCTYFKLQGFGTLRSLVVQRSPVLHVRLSFEVEVSHNSCAPNSVIFWVGHLLVLTLFLFF